jgi:hypothetical protein
MLTSLFPFGEYLLNFLPGNMLLWGERRGVINLPPFSSVRRTTGHEAAIQSHFLVDKSNNVCHTFFNQKGVAV